MQKMKSTFNEINAVVITAGSIEASDKNRASALLKPLDIYTTAGADADYIGFRVPSGSSESRRE